MSELFAYMAGVVDADGSIGIVSLARHKQYVIKLSVTNTKVELIEVFEREFGGKCRKRTWQKNPRWKDCYEWCLTADKAAKAIRLILPYLVIKRQQALLCLRLDRLKKTTNAARCRWDNDYALQKDRVYGRIKERCGKLNKRGVDSDASSLARA